MCVSLCVSPAQMLLYTCVAEFFSKLDTSGYLSFLSESLEGDTNVLQAFLGKPAFNFEEVCSV